VARSDEVDAADWFRDCDELRTEVVRLRAENDRLRGALVDEVLVQIRNPGGATAEPRRA
jgi:hypothetical protein